MAGPFRFTPPVLRPGSLTRPRLLRALINRFSLRCTVVVAGAGHGKTTLLAQALAENRLAPRGHDVWCSIEAADADATRLGRDVLTALDVVGDAPIADATAIAEAVWKRAPTEVCIVFDDVHELPPGSPGSALLVELVSKLPGNGHVLVAGRSPPSLPYSRLASEGALLRLDEGELRFDDEELSAFAAARNVDPAPLSRTAGWPAMAELVASAGADLSGDFLWHEVLEPIGAGQRRLFGVLCDLGGGDDRLLSAALGEPVVFDAKVPLVAVDAEGWHQPHPLWQTVRAIDVPAAERAAIRRGAAADLVARGRFDAAFTLLAGVELWDNVLDVLTAACRAGARPAAQQLHAWLGRCPRRVIESPAGQLASGVLAAETAPELAAIPLRNAIEGFRAEGAVDGELSAISHLGHVAWWQRDLAVLAELLPRVNALEATGHPTAAGLAALGRAVVCDINGDAPGLLAALERVPPGALDLSWEAVIRWFRARALEGLGDDEGCVDELQSALAYADPLFRTTVEATLTVGRWIRGDLESLVPEAAALLHAAEAAGVAQDIAAIGASSARVCAYLGDVEHARSFLARAHAVAAHLAPVGSVHIALADAALAIAEDDESHAAKILRTTLEQYPIDHSAARSTWQWDVVLCYVLVPDQRSSWDAWTAPRRVTRLRDLARAIVAGREATGPDPIGTVPVTNPERVRVAMPAPFAAELAVRLHEVGRTAEATALLEVLGEPGRVHARQLRTGAARQLLAAVPAPPQEPVRVRAFGPLEIADRPIDRARVRELLGFLVLHRTTTRDAVTAALWPDLDDHAASNNLRVTLSHLLHALEPTRGEGEAAYLVRQQGAELRLVNGTSLDIDVDRFESHLLAAAAAEADGAASVALEQYLAATDAYRGDLLGELVDATWAELDRERCRTRFVSAAVRAGELLVASNDLDRAEHLAQRALSVDEWAEQGYAVLASAALARGDRSAALRMLRRCDEMLEDLGVEASDATRQLARRVRAATHAG